MKALISRIEMRLGYRNEVTISREEFKELIDGEEDSTVARLRVELAELQKQLDFWADKVGEIRGIVEF